MPDFEKMAREAIVGMEILDDTVSGNVNAEEVLVERIVNLLRAAATVPDGFVRQGTVDMRRDEFCCGWCGHSEKRCPEAALEMERDSARREAAIRAAAEAARGEMRP